MSVTVRAVVADVVAEVAPEERPILVALSALDDARVVRLLRQRRGAEPLGFGLADLVAVATPIVWLAVDELCRTAVQSGVSSAWARMGALCGGSCADPHPRQSCLSCPRTN